MRTACARLRLRVVSAARATALVGRHGDGWKIRVAAPPERGAANAAVVALLARALALPPRSITVVAGHGARDKIVEFDGITGAELERRLAAADRKEG